MRAAGTYRTRLGQCARSPTEGVSRVGRRERRGGRRPRPWTGRRAPRRSHESRSACDGLPLPADGCRCQSPTATRSSGCNQSGIAARMSASGEASSCDVRAVALVRPRRSHRRRRGASSSTLPGPEVPTSLESLARKLADLAEDPVRHVTLKADLEPRPRVRPEHDAPRVLRRRLRRALRPGGPRRRRRQGGGRGRPPPDHAPSEFLDALVADREFLLERSVPCAHDRLEPGTAEGQLREVVGRRDDLAHVATCSRGSRPGGGGCSAGPGCSRRYARRATRISPDIDRSCARAEASSAARSGGSTNAETYLSLTRPCSSL